MEACYGGTDVMERSCAVARGIDINSGIGVPSYPPSYSFPPFPYTSNRREWRVQSS
jgi:hypothetical protein